MKRVRGARGTFKALALGMAAAVIGLAMACGRKADATGAAARTESEPVTITADANGFTPRRVELKQGAPGKLAFLRTSDETCATEVVFPELNLKKPLPLGERVVIDVPTDTARTLAFQCGMGMYKSAITVVASGSPSPK